MGIVLDIIIIVIIALNIFLCYKKGLVKLAVGLIAVLAAVILSIVLQTNFKCYNKKYRY